MKELKVSIEVIKADAQGDTLFVLHDKVLNDVASVLVAFRDEKVYFVITPEDDRQQPL